MGDARGALADLSRLSRKLEERSAALDRMAVSLEEVGVAARSFNDETLPRLTRWSSSSIATRARSTAFSTPWRESQSFVFGAQRAKPGPGRAGIQGRSALRHMLRSSRRIAALTLVLAGAGCSLAPARGR